MMNKGQIVTITFFRFTGRRDKWWAFQQMGRGTASLSGTAGLTFAKLLGSGSGNGFSIVPDLGRYGLLGVWEEAGNARQFFSGHPFFLEFRQRSKEYWTVFMRTAIVHGQWDSLTPFHPVEAFDAGRPVGVLTRATIHPRHLWRFWRFVPAASRSVGGREGLLFAAGIGELPLIQQATFSLWRNSRLMQAFAYQSPHHQEVIRRTRETGWYREELFARFHPYAAEGSWHGDNPLEACGRAGESPWTGR